MIRVVCFDLWNTLVRTMGAGASYEKTLVNRGVPVEKIFPFVRDQLMTGKFTYSEMTKKLFHYFAIDPSPAETTELINLWKADNKEAAWIRGARELVRKLRAQGRITVLVTNSTWPGWHGVNRRLEIAREFDFVYSSCNEGSVKPNTRVWETIESWCPEVLVQEFAMVGDREDDDRKIPRQRGWKVFSEGEMSNLPAIAGPRPTTLLWDTWEPCLLNNEDLRNSGLGINPIYTYNLTKTLMRWDGWQAMDPEKTVLAVPGNGGRHIADELLFHLPKKWRARVTYFFAKRVWNPGQEPWAAVNRIFPNRMVLGVKDVVLIDNVVSSGVSVQKIHALNKPWIPGAHWHALTWLAQRSANVPAEVDLVAAAMCGNRMRREPIASASTLIYDDKVLESFTARNFSGREKEVHDLLSFLRPIDPFAI